MTMATRQRILMGLAVLMMLAPTFLYAGGFLGRAPLFEGDTRKEMTCADCQGLGTAKDKKGAEEKCKTCRGLGVTDYIIPGPNRPIQLVGTLHDKAGKPLVGAEVAITEVGQNASPIVMMTNDDGQFGFKFPPGNFTLKLTHGKLAAQETLKVEPDLKPIAATSWETLHTVQKTFTLQ